MTGANNGEEDDRIQRKIWNEVMEDLEHQGRFGYVPVATKMPHNPPVNRYIKENEYDNYSVPRWVIFKFVQFFSELMLFLVQGIILLK